MIKPLIKCHCDVVDLSSLTEHPDQQGHKEDKRLKRLTLEH